MNVNCKNCKEDIKSYLTNLPKSWADQVADIVCKYIVCDKDHIDCEEFKDCETLTELSNFSIQEDGQVCIQYKDELGVTVTRCFTLDQIINNKFNDIQPNCLTDLTTWNNLTFSEKIQLLIDKVCEDCPWN